MPGAFKLVLPQHQRYASYSDLEQLGDLGHPENFNWTSKVFMWLLWSNTSHHLENRAPRVPPLTVLTWVAIVTLRASAAACEPVAGAIVLAWAVQDTARPILPWQTFCWQNMDRKIDRQTNKNNHWLHPEKLLCDSLHNNLQTQGERLLWRRISAQLWCIVWCIVSIRIWIRIFLYYIDIQTAISLYFLQSIFLNLSISIVHVEWTPHCKATQEMA